MWNFIDGMSMPVFLLLMVSLATLVFGLLMLGVNYWFEREHRKYSNRAKFTGKDKK